MNEASLSSAFIGLRDGIADILPDTEPGWLVEMRQRAFDRLRNRGLPTVRDEEWRYTDMRRLGKQLLDAAPGDPEGFPGDIEIPETGLDIPVRLVFVNGVLSAGLSRGDLTSGTVIVDSLANALARDEPAVRERLGHALPEEPHGFTCANSAYFRDGACVIIGDGEEVPEPIELVFLTASGQPAIASPRNLVISGENSRASIIERHIGASGAACLNNTLTEFFVARGATLDHYKIQDEPESGLHVSGLFVLQEGASTVTSNNIALGSLLARTDLVARLNGPGAHIEMNGLVAATGRQHVDNCTEVVHATPSCTSDEYYKAVLDDRARSVFRGRIVVAQDAQQTNADQQSKNLLLSDKSEADVKPQLEIYADDVKCSHGATVGQLDEQAIFYLRTRGIDLDSAKQLLTHAFTSEILERLSLSELRGFLADGITDRLAGRGVEQ